ncbi:MAG: SMI1/KNR4 family protein [Pseudomonadota bacterium]
MTDAELDDVEDTLVIELSPMYKAFMRSYPPALTECGMDATHLYFINHADTLIDLNEEIQTHGRIDAGSSFFAIGHDDGAHVYFIDIDDPNSRVYSWNHELGGFDNGQTCADLGTFAARVLTLCQYAASTSYS